MTDAVPPYISNRPPRRPRHAREQFRAENTLLLREVGRVVRMERLKRGMTRKLLAKHAATSERYLAQVELRDAGKSTLGAMLAGRLGYPFVELDKIVEHDYGAPVATLFEVYGQATFRRYERDALSRAVAGNENAVIATAGSIVADTQTLAQ